MNNIWFTWGDVFTSSFQGLWYGFIMFLPKLVVAVLLFIVGWFLGVLICKAIDQVFKSLKVDTALKALGFETFMKKAGMNLNSGYFVGEVAKWFVIVVFLMPSLTLVGLDDVSAFLKESVVGFLPQVIIAALVLIVAAFLAEALSKTVLAAARAMELKAAHGLSVAAKYVVWIFAVIIALGKIGLGDYMNILFSGVVAMVALSSAIAFGLGGKDAAADFLRKLREHQ